MDPNVLAVRGLVPRPQLVNRLSAAQRGAVTLVTAPAGSGKTALLRSWAGCGGRDTHVAWVAVERHEHDPQRFWRSVVDALSAAVGDAVVQTFSATPDFDGEAVVRRLMADLSSLDAPAVLIIDDLQELESSEALGQLEFLLARLPAELSVVLATRADPRLGLHRLRLAGKLAELRAADLRFSLQESRELLDAAGIVMSDAGLRLLYERTEGWVAGLRLTTIALQGYPDPEKFVVEFSGSERTVADYLLAEVLDHQPEEVRRLLLRTSVLERVSGALADAVTSGAGSERILQRLAADNAFVVPVDVGRTWFRYHQLFADLLRLELRRTAPTEVTDLHRRAAAWFAEHGFVVDAVAHAQAAGDWRQAVSLLSDNVVTLALDGRMAAVRTLLAGFPPDASATDAELATVFGAIELARGSLDSAAAHLGNAGRLAATVPAERRPRFDALLAGRRIALARYRGELGCALDASRSLDAALQAQPTRSIAIGNDARALALMHLGTVELWWCRLDDASHDLQAALGLARRAGRPYVEIGSLGQLATAMLGRSTADARRLSEEAIELAERHGWGSDPIVTQALAVRGAALAWAGRFDAAGPWLDRAKQASRSIPDPVTGLLREEARGLIHAGQGRFDEALIAFRTAEKMNLTKTTRVHSRVLQMRLRLGEVAEVGTVLATMPQDDLDRAESRRVHAAFHLAEDRPQQALRVLTPITEDVENALLFGLAHDRLGDTQAVRDAVERALELAEPGGLLLPFALQPVRALLEHHPRHRTAHAALLAEILDMLAGSEPRVGGETLHELSDAELRVLRYLPGNLGAPEIAAELYVSANTVKTHMRHIYTKLGAHRRTEAVERARALGLLAPR